MNTAVFLVTTIAPALFPAIIAGGAVAVIVRRNRRKALRQRQEAEARQRARINAQADRIAKRLTKRPPTPPAPPTSINIRKGKR